MYTKLLVEILYGYTLALPYQGNKNIYFLHVKTLFTEGNLVQYVIRIIGNGMFLSVT
jgi:hypothetical protein